MLTLRGLDSTKVSNKIELPSIADLLLFPFVGQVELGELYKNANSDLKNIIDNIPLRNDRNYVTVNMTVQLLSPNVTAAPRSNWHFDTSTFQDESESYIHLLLSECTALTEFLSEDVVLDQYDKSSDVGDVEVFFNHNVDRLVKNPIQMEANKFVTFGGGQHIHRAIRSRQPELRFMMRVLESDEIPGFKYKEALLTSSNVFNDGISDYSKVTKQYINNNASDIFKSISKEHNKIELFIN